MPFQFNDLIPEIYVSDFQRSLEFYVDILGFKVEYTRQAPRFAFLSYQGSQLMLQQCEPTDTHTAALEHPYGRGINFQIEFPQRSGAHRLAGSSQLSIEEGRRRLLAPDRRRGSRRHPRVSGPRSGWLLPAIRSRPGREERRGRDLSAGLLLGRQRLLAFGRERPPG